MSIVNARTTAQRAIALREIAFVDPGIADLGDLLRGLRAEVQAVVLRPAGDPVRQMADALDGRDELQAIHIIAHGMPGAIAFTAGALSRETLAAHARDLGRIGAALDADGELLLWSCETGKGVAGERLVAAIEDATGASVGAATGLVGATKLGGSWRLDAALSATAASPPLTKAGMQIYAGTFAGTDFIWNGNTSTDWGTS